MTPPRGCLSEFDLRPLSFPCFCSHDACRACLCTSALCLSRPFALVTLAGLACVPLPSPLLSILYPPPPSPLPHPVRTRSASFGGMALPTRITLHV